MIVVWFEIILKLNLNEVKMQASDTGQMYNGWVGWVTKLKLIYRKNNIEGVQANGAVCRMKGAQLCIVMYT